MFTNDAPQPRIARMSLPIEYVGSRHCCDGSEFEACLYTFVPRFALSVSCVTGSAVVCCVDVDCKCI